MCRASHPDSPQRRQNVRSSRLLAGAAATAAALVTALLSAPPGAQAGESAATGPMTEYNVLIADGASRADAVAAVAAEGGTVLRTNKDVRLMTVSAPRDGFVLAMAHHDAVVGAARSPDHRPDAGRGPRQGPGRDRGPARHRADRDRRTHGRRSRCGPAGRPAVGHAHDPCGHGARRPARGEGCDSRDPRLGPGRPQSRSRSATSTLRSHATSSRTSPASTVRASSPRASTRSAGTTRATARTSPARSGPR